MRVLIAGWQGQIASSLVALAPSRPDVTSFAVGRPALDLCELPTLQRAMSEAEPDVIINAAAYTAVDDAEGNPEEAYALNRDGARMMAATAAEKGIPLLHLSTGYVFDGACDDPYVEDFEPNPQTTYGHSKLEGELAVAASNPRHIILRTSWVFSAGGRNFVRGILERARVEAAIDVVSDQMGTPTYAPHLASAIFDVAAAICGREASDAVWGTYHAAGTGEASWFDLATRAMDEARTINLPTAELRPISSQAYKTVAARAKNARLSSEKLHSVFGLQLPDWRDGVKACVEEVASQSSP